MWRGTMQAVRSMEFAQDEPGHRPLRHRIGARPPRPAVAGPAVGGRGRARGADGPRPALRAAVAVTRDGGEGRVRLTARRSRPDRLPAGRRGPRDRAARPRLDGAPRPGRPGPRRSSRSRCRSSRHRVDGARRRASPLRRVRAGAGARWTSRRIGARSPRPTRWARSAWARTRRPIRPIRAAGSAAILAGASSPGLYVADTSTFPTAIGVNPMVTVMAMARRVSRTVLAESAAGAPGADSRAPARSAAVAGLDSASGSPCAGLVARGRCRRGARGRSR